jgi:adenylosuccinate lyase
MASHIIDSAFLKDLYGTDEMRAVFDDRATLQGWLDVEAALALAEAELGLIPAPAAEEIARQARAEAVDSRHIKELIDRTVHPIVPVVRALAEVCQGEAGQYVHWGATTQDIMDTALILQIKQATSIIERRLGDLVGALAALAEAHSATPMAGRTHGQQALPITFGFKVAIWLAEVLRHRERLTELKPRLLVGQFAGAVGTLASVPEKGLEVQGRMMAKLGLGVPLIAWHTARDGLAEFAGLLGLLTATLGKIAKEIIALQATEVGEVEEPFHPGKVGSSTMPHKRNPMLCEAVVALARLVMRNVPLGLEAMIQEHERDWSADHIEWAYLPETCVLADGALALTVRVLADLHVYPDRMLHNLGLLDGLILSEAVMLALAEYSGRQKAHEVVYECAMTAIAQGRRFSVVLAGHAAVAGNLSAQEIEALLEPQRYLGQAQVFTRRVLDLARAQRHPAA